MYFTRYSVGINVGTTLGITDQKSCEIDVSQDILLALTGSTTLVIPNLKISEKQHFT